MNTLIFKTKQHYLAMKTQWAFSCQSPKCKSTLKQCDEWLETSSIPGHVSEDTGIIRIPGWMQASHHILYNILRNKPIHRGFTEPTSNIEGKGYNLRYRHLDLILMQNLAKHLTKKTKILKRFTLNNNDIREMYTKRVTNFLAPFGDTLTIEHFAGIKIPTYEETLLKTKVVEKVNVQYNAINTELTTV